MSDQKEGDGLIQKLLKRFQPLAEKVNPGKKQNGYGAGSTLPLRFKFHRFLLQSQNTTDLTLNYNGEDHFPYDITKDPKWYEPIRNFPPPAEVRWKSLDGATHKGSIKLAKIFKDELIVHGLSDPAIIKGMRAYQNASQEKTDWIPDCPTIYFEVDDRTINIYMEMDVPLVSDGKELSDAVQLETIRVLVWSRTTNKGVQQ